MPALPVVPIPHAVKPPVDAESLDHRGLLGGAFWQRIPAYREIDEKTFLDHHWQAKHTITNAEKLLKTLEGLVSPAFIADANDGFGRAPMSVP